jgi:small subunit ribosomal protein S18
MRRNNRKKRIRSSRHRYAQLVDNIDYKDVNLLKTFTSNYQRILPAHRYQLSVQQQKKLATAVKRARYMALLPYTNGHK